MKESGRAIGSARAPDGVEIRYEVAEQGEQALVFIHGWSCDHSYWRVHMDRFALSHRVAARIGMTVQRHVLRGSKNYALYAIAKEKREKGR